MKEGEGANAVDSRPAAIWPLPWRALYPRRRDQKNKTRPPLMKNIITLFTDIEERTQAGKKVIPEKSHRKMHEIKSKKTKSSRAQSKSDPDTWVGRIDQHIRYCRPKMSKLENGSVRTCLRLLPRRSHLASMHTRARLHVATWFSYHDNLPSVL